MTPADVIATARTFIDTPFMHQGRTPGLGLDCAGLIVVTFAALGLSCQDYQGYGRSPNNHLLEASLDEQDSIFRIPVQDRQLGDVILLRFAGDPQHLAFDAGDTILHSYSVVGKVCEHNMTSIWANRIVRAYRVKGFL